MATTTVQGERKRIKQVILATALAMLVIGILVTAAGFKIQAEYNKVDYSWYDWYDCSSRTRITIPNTCEQYWSGFTVIFTSILLLLNYKYWPKIHKVAVTVTVAAVLLSMLSGLAVMSQDGEILGKLRRYTHSVYDSYYEDCDEDPDLDTANMHHLIQILHWLYVILIASNILVVLCLVQLMAFFAIWISEVKIQNPDQQNSAQQQPPTSAPGVVQFPSCSSEPQHHFVSMQDSGPQQQQFYQHAVQVARKDCGCRCTYHALHPWGKFHQCSHTWYPQEKVSIVVPPQYDAEEEWSEQETTITQPLLCQIK